ncbi:MAG: DNA repair protein RecO [Caldilineales bacterium]|nr:DNA repair protein RecO [Caldilineales bacterium]
MSRERLYGTRAIVLRHRDQGEADRVLTVMTPGLGKRTLLAKGVRRPASRKAGHLEPFTHVQLLIARGRSWDLITQAETVYAFRGLREDLERAAYAFYFVELVDAFVQEEDEHPEVFDLLLQGLHVLEQTDRPALLARWFELTLLRLSGYQPVLFHCVECGEALQPVTNYLAVTRGGMLCPRHGEGRSDAEALDVGALKVLRYLQTQPVEAVLRLDLSPVRLRQIERLLAGYIRFVVERRLRTPDFIHRLTPA